MRPTRPSIGIAPIQRKCPGRMASSAGTKHQQPDSAESLRDRSLHGARAEPARAQHPHEDGQQKRSDAPELQNEVGKISSKDADPVAGSVRSGKDRGAVERRDRAANTTPARGKGGARRRTTGIRRARSDAGSWWAQKSSRKMSCGSDGVARQTSPDSTVTWPELDHYDKKGGSGQCSKRDGVASWVLSSGHGSTSFERELKCAVKSGPQSSLNTAQPRAIPIVLEVRAIAAAESQSANRADPTQAH
jgi:hypothetical protein